MHVGIRAHSLPVKHPGDFVRSSLRIADQSGAIPRHAGLFRHFHPFALMLFRLFQRNRFIRRKRRGIQIPLNGSLTILRVLGHFLRQIFQERYAFPHLLVYNIVDIRHGRTVRGSVHVPAGLVGIGQAVIQHQNRFAFLGRFKRNLPLLCHDHVHIAFRQGHQVRGQQIVLQRQRLQLVAREVEIIILHLDAALDARCHKQVFSTLTRVLFRILLILYVEADFRCRSGALPVHLHRAANLRAA